jgi:hypothetical protein
VAYRSSLEAAARADSPRGSFKAVVVKQRAGGRAAYAHLSERAGGRAAYTHLSATARVTALDPLAKNTLTLALFSPGQPTRQLSNRHRLSLGILGTSC